MGVRVSSNLRSQAKDSNPCNRASLAPAALRITKMLTALLGLMTGTSLGALVYTIIQAALGKISPFNCVHFLQYSIESFVWYLVLSQTRSVFWETVNGGTPFSLNAPLRIRRVSILLIVLTLFGMLFSLAASWLCYGIPPSIGGITMGYSGFPAPETWQALADNANFMVIRQTVSIPLGSLLLPGILLLISIAMEYGYYLQKEHDETL